MEPASYLPVTIIVISFIVAIVGYFVRLQRQTVARARLAMFAKQIGLDFIPGTTDPLINTFAWISPGTNSLIAYLQAFRPFNQHSDGIVGSQLGGVVKGNEWRIFDYSYTEQEGKSSSTYRFQVFAVTLPANFPWLSVTPEGFASAWFGGSDINVESLEFNRKYLVDASSREFAFAILHAEVISLLIDAPALSWELRGNLLVVTDSGELSVETVDAGIRLIVRFLHLIPVYVREDYGGANWTF